MFFIFKKSGLNFSTDLLNSSYAVLTDSLYLIIFSLLERCLPSDCLLKIVLLIDTNNSNSLESRLSSVSNLAII